MQPTNDSRRKHSPDLTVNHVSSEDVMKVSFRRTQRAGGAADGARVRGQDLPHGANAGALPADGREVRQGRCSHFARQFSFGKGSST